MQCLIQTDVSISDFNRAWQYIRFFFSYETAMHIAILSRYRLGKITDVKVEEHVW